MAQNRNLGDKEKLIKHNCDRQYLICPLKKSVIGGTVTHKIDWTMIKDVWYSKKLKTDGLDPYWHGDGKLKNCIVITRGKTIIPPSWDDLMREREKRYKNNKNVKNMDKMSYTQSQYIRDTTENELLNSIDSDSNVLKQIFVSYGKHPTLRTDDDLTGGDNDSDHDNDKNDTSSDISSTIFGYYQLFNIKLNPPNQEFLVTRSKSPQIRDVMDMKHHDKQSQKRMLLSQLSIAKQGKYLPLSKVYPTGISSSFWYQLLNIPSILWRIENILNIYDIYSNLEYNGITIDQKLIYESLCNAQSHSGLSYENLEWFGDSVLKFAIALYLFVENPYATETQLSDEKKKLECNENLAKCCRSRNFSSYGIFAPFRWESWHPSFFWSRQKSLYFDSNIGNVSVKCIHFVCIF